VKTKEFEKLLTGIRQAGRIRRGEMKAGRVFDLKPTDIRAIRSKLRRSQSEFALIEVYPGAGGFNSLSLTALDFTLSPRVWHLEHGISNESTHKRGIFHTKNESLPGRRYHSLHILCGESLCSELAAWLKIGTTALVVALIDGGARPGDGVRLCSPLIAMRRFTGDPHCQSVARLRNCAELTALGIQRHYLRQEQRQTCTAT